MEPIVDKARQDRAFALFFSLLRCWPVYGYTRTSLTGTSLTCLLLPGY